MISAISAAHPQRPRRSQASTNWNGGALHFSNDYGFGLVDAKAAVRLAETWVVQSTSENMIEQTVEFSTGTFDPASGVFDGRLNKPTVEMIVEYVTVNIDFSVDDIKPRRTSSISLPKNIPTMTGLLVM